MIAESYLPVLIMLLIGLGMAGMFTVLGILLGPKRPTESKSQPFESGFDSKGLGNQRYDVKFYMTALAFLIFDVEIVFLYPWVVNFRKLGWFGFGAASLFLFILTIGLIYEWKKGALEWE